MQLINVEIKLTHIHQRRNSDQQKLGRSQISREPKFLR